MAKKGILERLKDGVVLGDGGYLLELEKRGWVQAGPFTPEVVLTRPEALAELHTEFLTRGRRGAAGAHLLREPRQAGDGGPGRPARGHEPRRACACRREVARASDCLVAGNISLTWMYEPDSPTAKDTVRRTFDEQLAVQVEDGVDFVIGETYSLAGRGAPRGRVRQEDRPARDGHDVLREQAR